AGLTRPAPRPSPACCSAPCLTSRQPKEGHPTFHLTNLTNLTISPATPLTTGRRRQVVRLATGSPPGIRAPSQPPAATRQAARERSARVSRGPAELAPTGPGQQLRDPPHQGPTARDPPP